MFRVLSFIFGNFLFEIVKISTVFKPWSYDLIFRSLLPCQSKCASCTLVRVQNNFIYSSSMLLSLLILLNLLTRLILSNIACIGVPSKCSQCSARSLKLLIRNHQLAEPLKCCFKTLAELPGPWSQLILFFCLYWWHCLEICKELICKSLCAGLFSQLFISIFIKLVSTFQASRHIYIFEIIIQISYCHNSRHSMFK